MLTKFYTIWLKINIFLGLQKKLYMRHMGLKSIFYLFTFITIKSKIFHITLYNLSCMVFIYILIHYKQNFLIDQFYLAVTAPWNTSRKMAYNRCAYISITKRARKLYLVSFCSPEKKLNLKCHTSRILSIIVFFLNRINRFTRFCR